jgi:hypothetical protein
MIEVLYYVSYFFGGVFFTNAIPHFVSGLMGRPFQSPFAKPSGRGLSSATVNVIWGFINLILGYIFLCRIGNFDIHSTGHAVILGLGILLMGVFTARNFGQFHGGNHPGNS